MRLNLAWNIVGFFATIVLVTVSLLSLVNVVNTIGTNPDPMVLANKVLDACGMFVCLVLLLTTLFDRRMNLATTYFLAMVMLEGFLLFWAFCFWTVDGDPEKIRMNKLCSYYVLGFIQLIMFAYWLYVMELIPDKDSRLKKIQTIYYLAIALGIGIILINPWTDMLFAVGDDGYYARGPMHLLSFLSPAIILIVNAVVAVLYIKSRRMKFALISYTLLPLIATIIQVALFGIGLINIALLFSIVLIYGNLYVERGYDLVEKQSELIEQQVTMMTAQIQPYFLYTSLDSISKLEGTPEETKNAIRNFSKYIEGNMDTFTKKEAIPFEKELEHVQTYVNLEKLRFKDKLEVCYELNSIDFCIPALTLQMLVENAIKHGVTIKEEGGSVKVITEETATEHKIIVIDDGIGFDTSAPRADDGRSHVGLSNIRQRLEDMVEGTLDIQSAMGHGTTAVVTIPKITQKV